MIFDPSESSQQAGREEPPGNPTGSSETRDTTDFQVVILAGGLGTRMQPITSSIPKPMIPVKGNPFLHYQLELLARFGLRRVLMLVAYLGEKIESHFGTGKALGIELAYCYEPTPLGTGGALKNAEAQLESEFIVLNGDTYLPIDYTALVRSFREQNTCAMIVAYRPSSEASSELVGSLPSNLAVSAGGRVTAYRKRDPRGLTHVDAGVLVLRKEVLKKIPRSRGCSLEEEVFPQMIAEGQMEAWVTSVPFYDMGTPAGLEALAARLP